jgi:hypothetical protein
LVIRTEASLIRTSRWRARWVVVAAIVTGWFFAGGICAFLLIETEDVVDDDSVESAAAIQALKASGIDVSRVYTRTTNVPSQLVDWMPSFVLEHFSTISGQESLSFTGDQVCDANLEHLRHVRGIWMITLTRAHVTDAWVDFLTTPGAVERIEIVDSTAESERGRSFLAASAPQQY